MTPTVELRPYQSRSIESIKQVLRAGSRRVLLCLPTGGGKTLTSGAIILGAIAKGKRVLFVAHRKELIDQSVTALYRLGVHPVGVIRAGDKRRNLALPVQVASIQTLARRPRLDPAPDIIVIDESHRALAKGYQEHLYAAYPNAIVIGLSATPCRADGKPLAGAFDYLVQETKYSELIAGGHIDEPIVYSTPVLPDLASVHTSDGDFNQADLEAAVNKAALIGNAGAEWQKHCDGRRTVVFCVSVAHSMAVLEMFRGLGVKAEHLDGTTPEDQRSAILARLASGETQLVCNVGVLTEGWDCPPVKCLVILRPTKSLSLWMQMAGRILRPWGGIKPLILDHGGNVDRHGLPHQDFEWSLKGRPKKAMAPPMKTCADCFAYIPAGCKTCPHCSAEQLAGGSSDVAQDPIPVDLALRTLNGDDAQLAFFREEHKRARDRGWRFGAAIHRFRERFGIDPPKDWIAALKSDHRRDVEWKERIKARPKSEWQGATA
jgi:DNA repair protein RadD